MGNPVVWFELVGQHGDSLQGFYREVLGWDFERPSPLPAVRRLRRPLAPWRRPARPAARPPWWMTFYTRVPDLEQAIAKARALGSRVLVPPTRHGDVTLAVISDPEGHPVGLYT